MPVAGPITHTVSDEHPALDIACRNGAEVRAAHDGHGRSAWSKRMGWTFTLQGEGQLRSSYSHLKTASGSGQYKRGDVIGQCGNTGTWSSGTHLHFTLNPLQTLRQHAAFARAQPAALASEQSAIQSYALQTEPSSSPNKNADASADRSLQAKATGGSLLQQLQSYGIHIDRLAHCGRGNVLAAYNRAAQRLCLARSLDSNPTLMTKVLTHEAVHVAQDCLGGLQNSHSASIAAHLKHDGGFSDAAIAKFFGRQTLNHEQIALATASLTPNQKQLELEAYALQNQGTLVRALLSNRCRSAQR